MRSASKPQRTALIYAIRESFVLLRSERRLLVYVLAVTLLGAAATGAGDPLSFKLLIDSLSRGDRHFFLVLAGCLLVLYTLLRLLTYISDLCSERLRNSLCRELTSRLIQRFYDLSYCRVNSHEKGYFISRLYDEPLKVTEAVSLAAQLVGSAAICIFAAGVCIVLSWQVSLIVSIIVPIFVTLANHFAAKIRQTSLEESEAEAIVREGLGRAVESYKSVRLFGLRPQVALKLDELLQRSLGASFLRFRHSVRFKGLSGTFLSYAETAVLVGAGFQVLQGALSLGGLFGFVSAYWRVVNSFHSLISLIPSYTRLAAQLERVREMAEAGEALPMRGAPIPGFAVRDLAFAYNGRYVLRGVDLRGGRNDRVLVVGPNGSGKSTLALILSGFLAALRGDARLPGLERTSALLNPFGFIPGNLMDNLAYQKLAADRRSLFHRLVSQLGLAPLLDRDPMGLSDGEKRKAQVLMTLLKEADFYLFDEPLSGVDPQSKDAIMDAILSVTSGHCLMVILHGDDQYRRHFNVVIDLCQPKEAAAFG
jgi:ABC-type multidrug transport system fused ATPase/permease subunit